MKTGSTAPAASNRWLPGIVLIAVLMSAASAMAQSSPAAAVRSQPESAATLRAVEDALSEGDPWEQLEWTFTVRPSLLYRRYLDDRGGELFSPRVSTTLQVRFGERPLQSLRRALRLERALRAHDRALRLEVRSALLAHAELLLAQDAFAAAEAAVAALPADADELTVQAAQLSAAQASLALDRARSVALGYGLEETAIFEPLRFRLPEAPDPHDLSLYRQQELAVAEAELNYLEAGPQGALSDLRLGVGWRTEAADLDLEAGLMAGRPGLRLGTVHPGGRARLELRVSATLALDDQLRQLPRLAQEVTLAQTELEELARQLLADWQAASEDAHFAEAELELAERQLAEAAQLLLTAQQELAEADPELDERALNNLQTAVTRAERELQRLRTRVYRAWITYVRRHHDLLEAAEADWEIR